jgi:hypothetical protein
MLSHILFEPKLFLPTPTNSFQQDPKINKLNIIQGRGEIDRKQDYNPD